MFSLTIWKWVWPFLLVGGLVVIIFAVAYVYFSRTGVSTLIQSQPRPTSMESEFTSASPTPETAAMAPGSSFARPPLPAVDTPPSSSVIIPGFFAVPNPTPVSQPTVVDITERPRANNALPGQPLNRLGQTKFRNIEELIDGSDVIVGALTVSDLDWNRNGPRMLVLLPNIFDLDRALSENYGKDYATRLSLELGELGKLNGAFLDISHYMHLGHFGDGETIYSSYRSEAGRRLPRTEAEELLVVRNMAKDNLAGSARVSDLSSGDVNGLWIAPSMQYCVNLKDNPDNVHSLCESDGQDAMAHKGLFDPGFVPQEYDLDNAKGTNLIYLRNPMRVGLFNDSPYTGPGKNELPEWRMVLFLRRGGPLDTDFDQAVWDEFFVRRGRPDGKVFNLFREAGDPGVALVGDDGFLRFLPPDDMDWGDRAADFRIHVDDLAARLASDNDERMARYNILRMSPEEAVDGYAEFMQTDFGRELFGPDSDPNRKMTFRSRTGLAVMDRNERKLIEQSTDPKYNGPGFWGVFEDWDRQRLVGNIERRANLLVSGNVNWWNSPYYYGLPGSRTVYQFRWAIPHMDPDHPLWRYGYPDEVGANLVNGFVALLPDGASEADVRDHVDASASRDPDYYQELWQENARTSADGGSRYLCYDCTAEDGDVAHLGTYSKGYRLVGPSYTVRGDRVLRSEIIVLVREPFIGTVIVQHWLQDSTHTPSIDILDIASALDAKLKEYITRYRDSP